jgi:membrane protein implicated in regulation of membrane protease activity
MELKKKVTALAVGIGLAVGAAVFAVFGLAFLFATIAAALATFLATWLALLIVTLGLLLLTAVLGMLAVGRIKKGTPPVPEQAIREAKLTTDALKSNGT